MMQIYVSMQLLVLNDDKDSIELKVLVLINSNFKQAFDLTLIDFKCVLRLCCVGSYYWRVASRVVLGRGAGEWGGRYPVVCLGCSSETHCLPLSGRWNKCR